VCEGKAAHKVVTKQAFSQQQPHFVETRKTTVRQTSSAQTEDTLVEIKVRKRFTRSKSTQPADQISLLES
jgi:hypothetical protein